ncbi:MAG: Kelch repeat-containing protein, partial [Candidatus Eiseniibacteriota bacterium]
VFGGYDGKAWHNGVGALTLAGTPSWSKLAPGGTLPNPIAGCRTAYDPVRDRLITFGGYDGFTFENGVWALSLAGSPAWSQLSTSGTPASTRSIVALVYDPNGDRVVISHGTEGLNGAIPQLLDDTWSVTLSGTPTWSELPPGPNDPAPRVSSSGIYDPGGTRMLIFGGYDGRDLSIATIFNDTHAFSNGATPGWSALAPTGTPPAARLGHSSIYDPIRHRMIVFGGRNYANGFNDVWALSLTGTPSWSLLAPTGTPPVARWYHTAVYDSKRDRMLVFGGVFGINNYNDVWELTLSGAPAWNLLAPTGAPPAIRNSHAAIYDPLRDRMVVYGGYNNGGAVTDLWALNLASGPAWSPLSMLGGPLTMSQSTAIYDPVRDRMLISGGFYGITSYTAVSALSLAGTPTWSALAPAGDVPAVRGSHASAYDPTHDQLLVFGGSGSVLLRDIAALFWGTPIAGVGPNEGITSFALAAPRPNPSRESSAIDFEVPSQSHVRLAVYDLAGRQVRLIEDAPFAPGRYTRHWDGTDAAGTSAPAGVYFLKLEAPGASLHAKLVRLR